MEKSSSSVSYKSFFIHETSRMLFEGALNTDIIKAYNYIECEDDWIKFWTECGQNQEQEGAHAIKNSNNQTAYEYYLKASQYYRLAQFHLYPSLGKKMMDIKKSLFQKSIDMYSSAIIEKNENIISMSIPFDNNDIKGYLHLPKNILSISYYPCVICIPGLGHNSISMHNWCKAGVDRGIAVFVADGPGYGSFRLFDNVELNHDTFNCFITTVLDFLSEANNIDKDKIGILGDCYGGYLAMRGASHDNRIKACAIIEPILAYGDDQRKGKPLPDLITYHLEVNEHAHVANITDDLLECSKRINCPVHISHAETDKLISIDIARKVAKAVNGESHLNIVKGDILYQNYINNHYNTILDELDRCVPDSWDWLSRKLSNKGVLS